MQRRRSVMLLRRPAWIVVALLALAGCSSAAAGLGGPAPGSPAPAGSLGSAPDGDPVEQARRATEQAVDQAFHAVRLPAGAVATGAVARLDAGAVPFAPGPTSVATRTAFYRVPLPPAAAAAWLAEHPAPGFRVWTTGGGGPPGAVERDLAARARDTADYQELTYGFRIVSDGASASLARFDVSAVWLDPRPARDDVTGTRLRITATGSCPPSLGDAVGVRPEGPPITATLVPAGAPTGGLTCEYGRTDRHGDPLPVVVTRLGAEAAGLRAADLRRFALGHPASGEPRAYSCPIMIAGRRRAELVALAFPGRPDVDLWVDHQCGLWVANGWLRTVP